MTNIIISFLYFFFIIYGQFVTEHKNDFTESSCSGNGFIINGKCQCQIFTQGDICQYKQIIQYAQFDNLCQTILERLDYLFNLSPQGQNYGDDFEFSYREARWIEKLFPKIDGISPSWIEINSLSSNFSIFSEKITPYDIQQSSKSNSYFFSALASLANVRNGKYIKDVFMTKQENRNNVYVTKWFIFGKLRLVAVSGQVPGYDFKGEKQNQAIFSSPNENQAFWGVILEKSWSKIFGRYVKTEKNKQQFIWKALTQAPTFQIHHDNYTSEEIFQKLSQLIKNEQPISCVIKNKNLKRQAFSVLGTYKIKMENDEFPQEKNIIKLFDPYNKQINYQQRIKWELNDEFWNNFRRQQLNFTQKQKGIFFLSQNDYKNMLKKTLWAEIYENYEASFKEIYLKKENKNQDFEIGFHLNEQGANQDIFISIDVPDKKLLQKECDDPLMINNFDAYDDLQNQAEKFKFNNQSKFQSIKFKNSIKGSYRIYISLTKNQNWIKQIAISVYSTKDSITWDEDKEQTEKFKQGCGTRNCYGNGICDLQNGRCSCFQQFKGQYCEQQNKCISDTDCIGDGYKKCTIFGFCQ